MLNFRDTVLAVVLAVACCALPILLISGISIGTGAIFRNAVLVVTGLAVIGYAVYTVTRRGREQR